MTLHMTQQFPIPSNSVREKNRNETNKKRRTNDQTNTNNNKNTQAQPRMDWRQEFFSRQIVVVVIPINIIIFIVDCRYRHNNENRRFDHMMIMSDLFIYSKCKKKPTRAAAKDTDTLSLIYVLTYSRPTK